MKKNELVLAVSEAANVSKKEAEAVITATFEVIASEIKNGEAIRVPGFGTFSTRVRGERTARNPRTNETVTLPATTVPVFKPGKELKARVNE